MPIYEYRCGNCERVSEVLHRVADEPPPVCPNCDEKKMERLLSAPVGVIMKPAGRSAVRGNTCCGETNPCDNSKHCCGH